MTNINPTKIVGIDLELRLNKLEFCFERQLSIGRSGRNLLKFSVPIGKSIQ